jgi:hypothetical protein
MQSNRTTHALPLLSSSFSSLIFAFLPKCPACLVLLLAPLGIKVPGSKLFLAYAIVMLAGIPLAFFLTPACRRCGTRPLFLALGGLAIMTIGRVALDSLVVMAIGALALFGASIWTARMSSTARVCDAPGKAMTACASKL